MITDLVTTKSNIIQFSQSDAYDYLTEAEVNALIQAYRDYMIEAKKQKNIRRYMKRYRQFLIFMILRETGARLSEVLLIDDTKDIDFDNNSIKIRTLKRKKETYRTVFISDKLIAEISKFLMMFPQMRGRLFKINKRSVQYYFELMCKKANIHKKKSHIHILRHTRAVEFIKANIPLHHIKQILGHSSLITTSVYLNVYSSEIKQILEERNFI